MKMRFIGITLAVILFIGCAPSLIKRDVDENRKIGYEISKGEETKIKGYAMKIADSLLNLEIKNIMDNEASFRDTYLKIHIDELKWYCSDRSKIEAEGFAVGFAGGLIGASIWGTKNFTTVYGISNIRIEKNIATDSISVNCMDTISFEENYMNYSSSKTKKKAISDVFNKSLDCVLSRVNLDNTQETIELQEKSEEPLQ
jgi:hypothetical protein